MPKQPLELDVVMGRVREAVRPFPRAAMFELAERGYDTPFQQLVACVISIRTRDEDSLPISLRLLARAPSPSTIAALDPDEIDALIRDIARRVVVEHGWDLPCDEAVMRAFPGVGTKCANLALGIACGQERISVDVHVHRITNRWGFLRSATPEQTTRILGGVLPRRYHAEINALLVPFGKHVCTGVRPRCSTCPVLAMCAQVGVTDHR